MAAAPPPSNRNLKKADFVYKMKINVLRDLPFSRNHLLKLAMISILEF
jgi:hypothetical protein